MGKDQRVKLGHDDLGRPTAYLAIVEGTPVYGPGGERVGIVDEVVADEREDIFRGLVLHTLPLPGRHLFADADQIAGIYERGVVLAVAPDSLPEPPRPQPPTRSLDKPVRAEPPLEAALRRIWDWLTRR